MEEPNAIDVSQSNLTSSGNETNEQYWSVGFSTAMAVILSMSAFLTIVGNAMVIAVVIRYPVMRTRTNLFLMNLAVADFLVGLLVVPCSVITLVSGHWVLGDVLCKINGFLNAFCLVASIHTLTYISIHKCYSLPRRQMDSFKLRHIVIMMAATWIWAAFLATITVDFLSHVLYKPGTSQCGPVYPHDLKTYIHHGLIQATGILIPLVIMIYCYIKMFRMIWYHSRSLQENTTMEHGVIIAQQKKIFVTLFIVLACFICCWLPYHIYASYTSYIKDKTHFYGFINPLAYAFGYINSAFNPIIYALRSKSFRNGYKEIWCQTKGYFSSEESLRDDGESPMRKFSSFFSFRHGSLVRSRQPLDRSGISLNTMGSLNWADSRKASLKGLSSNPGDLINKRKRFKRNKSLTEMMRDSSKSGTGSSIFSRDGTIVIMKAGKIVSVREDKTQNDAKRGSSQIDKKCKTVNGNYKQSLNKDKRNENGLSTIYNEMELSTSDADEVFEENPENQYVEEDEQGDSCDNGALGKSETNDVIKTLEKTHSDVSNIESVDYQESHKKLQTELSENSKIENSILSTMALTPFPKYGLAKSDVCLEVDSATTRSLLNNENQIILSKSNSNVNRFFSNVDFHKMIPRSLSEKKLNLYKSPLLQRRVQTKPSQTFLLSPL